MVRWWEPLGVRTGVFSIFHIFVRRDVFDGINGQVKLVVLCCGVVWFFFLFVRDRTKKNKKNIWDGRAYQL
jgi:hypothetical protein